MSRGPAVVALAPVSAGAFDVALTVERGAPADDPPGLAFTGAPILVLIAILVLLLALGLSARVSAKRREAERGG